MPQSETTGAPLDAGEPLAAILLRFRLRAQRRAAWLRELWREEEARSAPGVVGHAEVDSYLEDRDAPEAESKWLSEAPHVAQLNTELARLEAAITSDRTSRFGRLRALFHLSDMESDLLQACLAVAADPSLARVSAYLQDDANRPFVTESLVGRLFGHGRNAVFGADSAARRWNLVVEEPADPGVPPALRLDRALQTWLQGGDDVDPFIREAASHPQAGKRVAGWPVEPIAGRVEQVLSDHETASRRFVVSGLPLSGRKTFVAAVMNRLGAGRPLAVNVDRIAELDWPEAHRRALRHALLSDRALVWHGDTVTQRWWPSSGLAAPLQFVVAEPDERPLAAPEAVDERIELPVPSIEERRDLWRALVPESAVWPRHEFELLAAQHRVLPGEAWAVAKRSPGSPRRAVELLREFSRDRLGRLAERLETPFSLVDLVIDPSLRDALEELMFEAQARPAFWEKENARRLFPQGRGLLALFSGPPGTGKTMAAQVIGAVLNMDVYRIDLSAVVSKYVGETSQNLDRILSRAAHMDAVLFFDEADALFGKRTEIRDAHDRFANTDTNYLLQAIESFQGIALLATNKKGNIDPAFVRRLRYVLEFQKPDAAQRLEMWRRVVRELVGEESQSATDRDLGILAESVEATGAQIKFSVLSGIFSSRRAGEDLSLRTLVKGAERELAKEGRSLSGRDRERILHHA